MSHHIKIFTQIGEIKPLTKREKLHQRKEKNRHQKTQQNDKQNQKKERVKIQNKNISITSSITENTY